MSVSKKLLRNRISHFCSNSVSADNLWNDNFQRGARKLRIIIIANTMPSSQLKTGVLILGTKYYEINSMTLSNTLSVLKIRKCPVPSISSNFD